MSRRAVAGTVAGLGVILLLALPKLGKMAGFLTSRLAGPNTVAEALAEYGSAARGRLEPYFQRASVPYPPERATFLGLKTEGDLQLYAAGPAEGFRYIRSYRLRAVSGDLESGPVEENQGISDGVYQVDSLHPNSRFNLGLRLRLAGLPESDRTAGGAGSGGNAMMRHSSSPVSLTASEQASEELFVLTAQTGLSNVTVILSPVDFRLGRAVSGLEGLPTATRQGYEQIQNALGGLPLR